MVFALAHWFFNAAENKKNTLRLFSADDVLQLNCLTKRTYRIPVKPLDLRRFQFMCSSIG